MALTSTDIGLQAQPFFSIDNLSSGWNSQVNAFNAGQAWGVANRAIYVPIRVPTRCVVKKLGFVSSTVGTGNYDIGLYDASGSRLLSRGSTAKGTTAETVAWDCTDTTIGPGLYYIGLNNDTTTDTFIALAPAAPIAAAYGLLTEAVGSVTLPATATWTVDSTLALVPMVTALLSTVVA